MRKLITLGLMAATALPTLALPGAAQAQSRNEIRRDRQDVREEQRELRDAQRYGNPRDVREQREDVREARQELREDRRDRRQHSRNYTRYNAPTRNWSYRPVRQGYNLQPNFYSQRYYAPGYRAQRNARWIRYGDDLLLVNTRNGRVLQVRQGYYY